MSKEEKKCTACVKELNKNFSTGYSFFIQQQGEIKNSR